tara:strand:- start:71 stop:472 length:402 start_codon:yes stop_codon:yes gene_type:complete
MINVNIGEVVKILGSFVAKNWQTLALIGVIVLFFVSKNDFGALKKSMEVMTVSYQEQIASMEALHKRELKLREDSIANYEKQLADLTKRFDTALEELQQNKKEDIDRFTRDFDEQPDELAREIQQRFGFNYVE